MTARGRPKIDGEARGTARGSSHDRAAAMFVVGLFVSEGLFGWATEEELQPNIEGLSFDEVAVTFLVGIVVVLVARGVMWRRSHRPGTA